MSGWKQPFLLSTNKNDLNACIMILETNKKEEEEYLYFSYKTNDNCNNLINLKGIILASEGISHSIFNDDLRISLINTNENKYKITCKIYLKSYLISVIMPSNTPDNILIYVCREFSEFLTIFFERFEETTKFFDILNKYCEVLLFNTINYSIIKENEDLISTPITLMPIINITFTYNENFPCFIIKPPINDSLRTEIIEILNTLNSDRSVLQETLTLMDPPFYMRGYALLFNGFVIFNSLSNKELLSITRLAMLHEMFYRSNTSHEVLSCEFLFEKEDFDSPQYILNKTEEKRKILVTLLAQREFVILISLEIQAKNNCSFDPFFHKRAEDLILSLIKKGYNTIIKNELLVNSIKMIQDKNNEEKIFNEINSEVSSIYNSSRKDSKKKLPDLSLHLINSKIRGYIDYETKVNIIHFSFYDDAECLINTSDLNLDFNIYKEIYRIIFIEYARIQSNINKLKKRNKLMRLREIYQYDNLSNNYNNIFKKDNLIKSKLTKEKFLSCLNLMKINEYAIRLNVESNLPIWVCCKLYEHSTIEDDTNLEEFSNFKIIFVTYESLVPVDIDSFCQDLMINELFI